MDAPRVLVVDDNPMIHEDVRKILIEANPDEALLELESELFGGSARRPVQRYRVDSAFQGEQGLEMVRSAMAANDPYPVALIDMRMPPGWTGIETIARIWKEYPELQVVICSAYSDYTWDDIVDRFGTSHNLLVLKKPFEPIEVKQMVAALTCKWQLQREDRETLRLANEELSESNRRLRDEIVDRARVELELRLAQKLEAVGRLAAGVAHEINTPVQFVSDSIHYVKTAMSDLAGLVEKYRTVTQEVLEGRPAHDAAVAVAEAEEDADLPYLLEHVPKALVRSIDGLGRVATIVRSMKEFSHHDQKIAAADLNRAILSSLTIAKNEYKFVADVETDLGDIPLVTCHLGEINQLLLNLIVNASHAIGDVVQGSDRRGVIRVTSEVGDGLVSISIRDSGGGIPEDVRDRIFDPFFTTKGVGKGTGQGLPIARAVAMKHGGDLTFETVVGAGTTFLVRLPVAGPEPDAKVT